MSLIDKVQQDLMVAMKAQEKTKMGALRMLKTALKNAQIEAGTAKGGSPPSGSPLESGATPIYVADGAETQILMKLCKQRRESIEMFEKICLKEPAATEKAELAIIETYLPEGVSDEELAAIVDAALKETGANQPKQMGQVIGAVMKKLAGKPVDGKKISELVKARLAAAG